ncbi:TauD/TfdA dioxygenase family protein [Caulobacter sp.]|uniref:TauD/TfdA dioxygenase family protein n=1 Tax=Caulobacter sp. TaxID=78 RepID=UPI003BA9C624
MAYEVLDVKPMTRRIGAEIFGVDLGRPMSNRQFEEMHQALTQYQVLFFRDQDMTHEAHKDFGRKFGDLAIHSGVPGLPDHPEIVAIHADANSKFVAGETWHSDLTCDPEPPLGSILYMKVLPEFGGDTCFASMYAAYETLSDKMKAYLEGLSAVHDANPVYKAIFPDIDRNYNCSTHPIVRTHPVSGRKSLFVNPSYTTHIAGLPKAESAAILGYLYQHAGNPDFQVRFRWKENSVAFWDNRCTWHQAIWDYFPDTRTGYRVTVAGDKPF